MDVSTALQKRKSVRAFLDKKVDDDIIKKILQAARYSPSGVNMQPWSVYVVSGDKKNKISDKMVQAFENAKEPNMDYQYYPDEWIEPYKSRRKETGLLMYETLGITKEDKKGQHEQWSANYRAFDAPVVLYFFIDSVLQKGSFLDYGMFLQSIMLMATELGIASCTQAALAQYPDIVRDELEIEDNKHLVCGIALGYEDTTAPINSYKTSRIDLDDFVVFSS